MSVPLIMSNDKLALVVNGKTWHLSPGDPNYLDVIQAVKDNQTEDEIYEILNSTMTLEGYVESQGNCRVKIVDGVVIVDGEELHSTVADRLLEFKRNNLPLDHLIKFIERIADNPSYNSRNQLYNFLENKDLVITEDGFLLAYKGVNSDYTDKYTGTIDNTPGQTVRMNRNLIDDNPGTHCSKGLHVGAISYATNWAGNGRVVIVKVDPANVVSVPNDFNCQKCRVCEYTVVRDSEGLMKQPLYTTDGEPYRPETYDGDWDFTDDEVEDVYDDGEVYSYDDDGGYCMECGQYYEDCDCDDEDCTEPERINLY